MISLRQASPNGQMSESDLNRALVAAINNVQAVISFTPDGVIQHANENFLAVMGYQLDEIVGKHHSIFCEQQIVESPDYAAHWAEISKGKTLSARYRRITKSGRHVWIEASYNPIMDRNGKVVSVTKFAIDVSKKHLKSMDHEGQIAAINRSQATIEFQPDGTIVSANDNFLDAMGYSLAEIQGKHHRMFVDPEFAKTSEYLTFWDNFKSGEPSVGQFKRIGRNGNEIWIQASYNPILDEDGNITKIVKFASDITPQRVAVAELEQGLEKLSHGDLTHRIPASVTGDFASLRESFNATFDRLGDLVGQIRAATEQLLSSSSVISTGANTLSQRGEQQAASLEETNAAMEQISVRIKQSADNAGKVRAAANEAADGVSKGEDIVRNAISAMDRIENSSREVSDIIKVIDSIAFQTNILSLNAAVEAARAGNAGKGFAVVAQEVRMLAQRSADAAKDITELIQTSTKEVETGARFVRQSGEVLAEINSTTDSVVQNVSAISEAAEEQAMGVNEIHRAVNELDSNTQHNAQLAVESVDQAASMSELANNLNTLVAFFSTGSSQGTSAPPMARAS